MIQIALLLFGANFVRRNAYLLGVLGLLWLVAGLVIFIDALDGVRYFPLVLFGVLLLIESVITLSVAASGIGAQKAVLYFKGGGFFLISLLILVNDTISNILLAIILGMAYFVMGTLQMASAWLVRFPNWRTAFGFGLAKVVFAIVMFGPYPSHYSATISVFMGVILITGGIVTLNVFLRARQLKDGTSVFELFMPSDVLPKIRRMQLALPEKDSAPTAQVQSEPLTVHVWTPEGSSKNAPVRRPVINRYIAAVDVNGVISTGHAALEMLPQTYISLYPAADIDRSPSEFFRILKATGENDVAGLFQPDYATESKAWCPSNWQVKFHAYNRDGLLHFWQEYRQHEVYNLTYRNCSSSVSYALEAALDGALHDRASRSWTEVLRVMLMPELWIAAQIRKRATTMAWTPGLTLDYARALCAIVHPVSTPWFSRLLRVSKASNVSVSG
ncbi:MFS transporter [Advenella sp. S44]|uniref:HdeD family acid-resistance protein n=1 Tax=Advenella sp. S44 TaxID=1982755 RepID=UPI000C2AAA6B|nr:MFS transporter [Advenella sp. S44]PJX20413.1 MFS transporter [Advenella sp. S44]